MGNQKNRPVQPRSIETRKRLLNTAIRMYAEKGYHYVTVDEIAAQAGISTGAAYRYFKNKKDLLLSAIEYGFENIPFMTNTDWDSLDSIADNYEKLSYILEQFVSIHREYYAFHEELEGLRHSDIDVKQLYQSIETKAIQEITLRLGKEMEVPEQGEHFKEKLYIAVGMLEQYCHIAMEDNVSGLNLDVLKEMTIKAVLNLS